MKRIAFIVLLILILAIPSLAETEQPFSPYDYVTGSAGGGRFIYYDFPDVTLYLPAEWEGLFTVERDEFGVAFYHTASHEKYLEEGLDGGGFLFRLCASEDEGFRDLLAYAYLGYSENAGLHFYLTLPPEYTAYPDEAIMAEYDEMAGQIDAVVVENAQVAPNMSFYPGDDIGLDGNDLG